MPTPANTGALEFVKNPPYAPADTVKIIGSKVNVDLINRLHEEKNKNKLRSLKVCSPMLNQTSTNKRKVEAVLLDIDNWDG